MEQDDFDSMFNDIDDEDVFNTDTRSSAASTSDPETSRDRATTITTPVSIAKIKLETFPHHDGQPRLLTKQLFLVTFQ